MAQAEVTDGAIAEIARIFIQDRLLLATAESCTGGLLASTLTSLAGSSEWFEGGFVTYRLSAKSSMLGVTPTLLKRYGAVSEEVARTMAQQTLERSDAHFSIATTGLAGPAGDSSSTAIGSLWIAWARQSEEPRNHWLDTQFFEIHEPRAKFREIAVKYAIYGLLERLKTR
jgi:nicotinamide-nucleotide amidase